jgi:hypothetical protein
LADRRCLALVRPYNEGIALRKYCWIFFFCILIIGNACKSRPRSEKSFDEISRLVAGRSATEVEALLGRPDSRQDLAMGDKRWVWWNFTSLDGESYAPELRGKIVHLEITFSSPIGNANASLSPAQWKVSSPLSVSYVVPQARR